MGTHSHRAGPARSSAPRVVVATLAADALTLQLGGRLAPVEVGYTLYGDPERPLVVVLGGISAGRLVASQLNGPPHDDGWWTAMVGPGRAVDTDRFAVLGVDFLGGCGASTRAASGFPSITTGDQASALALVLDHLRIGRVHAIVGSSYGGMVALAFAERFATRVARLGVISAAHESHPMATALRALQRRAVRLGVGCGRPEEGLAIARGIAMTTYRTAEELAARFHGEPDATPGGFVFPVERYLGHHGQTFARRFSPEALLCLSESLDLHRVEPAAIATPTTLVAVTSDTLVPPWQVRALAARLAGPVDLAEIASVYGHDAFLKETEALTPVIRHTLEQGATR